MLLVILSAVLAARSPAWAAAVGTATAVYTVIAPDNQGPRS
ncbi:hypothetical protein [Streptomyces griseomycini]|uniref:Uncharacterized protein n=1 Tax=Streptomyces griseomycini TaxID=66895 RepID=A0A7W7PY89_9ACTN|nr:hypothetical protein [Streptomyces griseomycini]MBB4903547.1 hypothetical protein [Streptomyces griseomycini]